MPNLDGFLIVARDTPSFVVPVLVDRPGSNHSLIQKIDANHRISAFYEIDVGNNYERSDFKFEFNIGDEAIWGFRDLNGEVTFSDFKAMKDDLKDRQRNGEFKNFPLIESQTANFCDDSSTYIYALSKSYELLQSRSELAAAIWRDASVLLPRAKGDLARVVPKHLATEIESLRLFGAGTAIRLEMSEKLHDFFGSNETEILLTDTMALGRAFGLNSYSFATVSSDTNYVTPESTFDEMYGELVPFTGIGDMAAQNRPSFVRTKRLIPPWIDERKQPSARWPLVSFCVINTDISKIEAASTFAKSRGSETIKIAIVTSPITFGASRGHKLDPTKLDPLRPAFDYVFIIGNHILQRPTGSAYRLAASSRAVKYVRACIDGIMQIVWASGGPSTPKEFFRLFPRSGFGLVGRSLGTKDTPPQDILQDAITSALNERLPLHLGKRLVVVGSPPIVNHNHILSFLDRAAEATLNETMSVVSTSRRAGVTLLFFGIRPVELSEGRHREFCLELLLARGFSILRRNDTVIHGAFFKGKTIAVGFSSSERSLNRVTMAIEKTSTKTRCVLTNFKPSLSSVAHYWSRRIAVFHYSLLDTYLERKMTSTHLWHDRQA